MANVVLNKITFNSEEELKKLLFTLNKNNILEFSFNTIIPKPKTEQECIDKYGEQFLVKKETLNMQDKELKFLNWYEWQLAFWGTKWDAYDVDIYDSTISFYTAWTPPYPVIKKLPELNIPFTWNYSEENCSYEGEFYFDGEQIGQTEFKGDDAYKHYNEVWGLTFYKPIYSDGWFTEDDPNVFWSQGYLYYFDTAKKDLGKAMLLHKECGKDFDDFIVSSLEEEDEEFLRKSIGFLRINKSKYVVDKKFEEITSF